MSTDSEFMARTVVNLPFIDERFEPGQMIPVEAIERYVAAAAAAVDDRSDKDDGASPLPTVESEIERLTEWGSITTDPEDGVLPEHLPPDPNRPSMAAIVAQAQALVELMEEAGEDVPAKLRAVAEISDKQISSVEQAVAKETQGGGDPS